MDGATGSAGLREGCCVRCRMGQNDLAGAKARMTSIVMAAVIIAMVIGFVDFMIIVFEVDE